MIFVRCTHPVPHHGLATTTPCGGLVRHNRREEHMREVHRVETVEGFAPVQETAEMWTLERPDCECGAPRPQGQEACASCMVRDLHIAVESREGRCTYCTNDALPGVTYCDRCKQRLVEWKRQRIRRQMSAKKTAKGG